MHRLFTATAILISGLLIAQSADARPIEVRELHIKSAPPKSGESVEPKHKDWINLNRVTKVQWKAGLTSTNVRLKPRRVGNLRTRAGESGQKGGTADINIGVGELQECTISKSMDMASPLLARLAKTRRALPVVVLSGLDASGRPFVLRLKNVRVKSYRKDSRSKTDTIIITYTGLE